MSWIACRRIYVRLCRYGRLKASKIVLIQRGRGSVNDESCIEQDNNNVKAIDEVHELQRR